MSEAATTTNPLYNKACGWVKDRAVWESRQRVWYQMRHDGLRRKNKPFPGAADLHFPLIDTVIEKLKPFYFNQVFTNDRLAMFVPIAAEASGENNQDAAGSAAEFFDYKVRHETNIEEAVLSSIDTMLLKFRGIVKARYDFAEKKIVYEPIDPFFLLVPASSKNLADDDFVHVKQLTISQYRKERAYTQNPEIIGKIRGKADTGTSEDTNQQKFTREGITFSNDPDQIIVWEHWHKGPEGFEIHTYSPALPAQLLRKSFRCPLRFRGEEIIPFISFVAEIKDEGWYAPRGIAERLGHFEAWLCKQWNEKADSLSFLTKPLFERTGQLNNANFRFRPGEILPDGVKPAQMPTIPIAFDQEIQSTRQIAEQSVMMPDFGVGGDQVGDNKTATEVDYIRSLSSTGVDLKGRIFRISLGQLYRITWALILEYCKDELTYFTGKDRKVLPQQALHDNYIIQPEGAPDQWNKQQRMQRSLARFQLLKGHPNINQEELVKQLLETDDAHLVKRLFVPSQVKAGNEAEDEAIEIMLMMNGYPAQLKPEEDHAIRAKLIIGKLQQLQAKGVPVDPQAATLLNNHLQQHLELLKKQNPDALKEIEAGIAAAQSAQQPTDDGQPAPEAVGAEPMPEDLPAEVGGA